MYVVSRMPESNMCFGECLEDGFYVEGKIYFDVQEKLEAHEADMGECKGCIHYDGCGYFDSYDHTKTEEENFIENCVGCCCGDGYECNKANNYGCMNWEDGSEPLLG